jgi:hypothetical protein
MFEGERGPKVGEELNACLSPFSLESFWRQMLAPWIVKEKSGNE